MPEPMSHPLPGVLLLASSNTFLARGKDQASGARLPPEPPLGLYRIKQWLEDKQVARVRVLDAGIVDDIEREVREFAAQGPVVMAGVSLTRIFLQQDLENIRRIRDWIVEEGHPAPVTLVGGFEATLDPELILSMGYVDAAVQGFGEFPLEALSREAALSPTDDMAGTIMGRTHHCITWRGDIPLGSPLPEPQPPQGPVDPAQLYTSRTHPSDIIPWSEYWAAVAAVEGVDELPPYRRAMHVSTTSHCMGACGFCSSRRFGTQILSAYGLPTSPLLMDAEDVEALVLKGYEEIGCGGVYFAEDDFTAGGKRGMDRFLSFCKAMEAHYDSGRLPRDFWLGMQTKTRHFFPGPGSFLGGGLKSLKRLKRAGFLMLEFGVESFSEELLQSPFINKNTSAEVNKAVIAQCLEAGIRPSIFYIPFPPTVRPETFAESLNNLVDLVEKGARMSLSPFIRINSGSAASKYAGDPAFPVRSRQVTKADGSILELPDQFLPQDERMAEALKQVMEKENKSPEVIKRQQFHNHTLLADVAEILGYDEPAERLRRAAEG